ncbi:formyl transferase family protein [Francisella philomiragia]|uniref:formyltransferase family protein n=1 Tax=Francisella philomiragia TaxID=28110 RepID=UPI0005A57346|nr:formyltransferase family protein [Francisella philomiragia]AJI54440.1 formyl transferase family protein [Francisella philomiragia]MBK2253587.1 hypothetical protein [Francisella philomiragia]
MSKDKIVFFSHDSIFARLMLDYLLSQEDIEIVGVVLSTCIMRRGKSPIFDYWRLYRTCGLNYILYLLYANILYPIFRKNKFLSIKQQQKKHNFKVVKTLDVNSKKVTKQLQDLEADYFVSGHFNQIFSEKSLEIPKRNAINIHPSLLPNWKGVDPVVSAIANNSYNFGVTVHRLTIGIDQGDIYEQKKLLSKKRNLLETYMSLFQLGIETFTKVRNQTNLNRQDNTQGSYYSWPSSKDFRKTRDYFKR